MFLKRIIRVKQHPRRLPGRDSESTRPSSGAAVIASGLRDASAMEKAKQKAEREAKEAEVRGVKTVTAEELLSGLKRSRKSGEKTSKEE